MFRREKKEAAPLFAFSLYPPMALLGYLVAASVFFLGYGIATGIADATYTSMFLGLTILLLYCLYFILSQRVLRARFRERTFSIDGRRNHRDLNYREIGDVSGRKMIFGLVTGVEITLRNERTPLRILGNPRNSDLQVDLRSWLLTETGSRASR